MWGKRLWAFITFKRNLQSCAVVACHCGGGTPPSASAMIASFARRWHNDQTLPAVGSMVTAIDSGTLDFPAFAYNFCRACLLEKRKERVRDARFSSCVVYSDSP